MTQGPRYCSRQINVAAKRWLISCFAKLSRLPWGRGDQTGSCGEVIGTVELETAWLNLHREMSTTDKLLGKSKGPREDDTIIGEFCQARKPVVEGFPPSAQSTAVFAGCIRCVSTHLHHCCRSLLSIWQGLPPLPPGDAFGCVQSSSRQDCWAGVYVDSASKEVLHLESGGRALRSPGTAVAADGRSDGRGGCLWWSAQADVLHIVDCLGRPFLWPGASGNLRRDPHQAGVLAGFGFEVDTTVAPQQNPLLANSQLEQLVHLMRDPLGLMFPGCLYILLLPSRSPISTKPRQIRVLLHRNGTVTDEVRGTRVATWSFAAPQVFPGNLSESGTTGDALELRFDDDGDDQVQRLLI